MDIRSPRRPRSAASPSAPPPATPSSPTGRSRPRAPPCGGRSSTGTFRRFTRIRYQAVNRPRIWSTITSAADKRVAASGCRAFHRPSPSRPRPSSRRARSRSGEPSSCGARSAPPSSRAPAARRRGPAPSPRLRGLHARRLALRLRVLGRPRRVAEPRLSCCVDSSSSGSIDPAASSMPSHGSPMSAYRLGTLTSVNASGSRGDPSHVSGARTRARRASDGPSTPRPRSGPSRSG